MNVKCAKSKEPVKQCVLVSVFARMCVSAHLCSTGIRACMCVSVCVCHQTKSGA